MGVQDASFQLSSEERRTTEHRAPNWIGQKLPRCGKGNVAECQYYQRTEIQQEENGE
jgi:hypothetical protein